MVGSTILVKAELKILNILFTCVRTLNERHVMILSKEKQSRIVFGRSLTSREFNTKSWPSKAKDIYFPKL